MAGRVIAMPEPMPRQRFRVAFDYVVEGCYATATPRQIAEEIEMTFDLCDDPDGNVSVARISVKQMPTLWEVS